MPDLLLELRSEEDSGAHAAQGRRRPAPAGHRRPGRGRAHLRGGARLLDAAAAGARRARADRPLARCDRGAQGAEHQGAGDGSARLPGRAPAWPRWPRPRSAAIRARGSSMSPAWHGRGVRPRRSWPSCCRKGAPGFSVAEGDALGRSLGSAGKPHLGATAASDPLRARAGAEATDVVDFSIAGIRSGRTTYGHRFMRRRRSRCAASTTTSPSSEAEGRPRPRPPQADDPCRRPRPRAGAEPGADRRPGPARGGRWAGRMAGRSDRRFNDGSWDPAEVIRPPSALTRNASSCAAGDGAAGRLADHFVLVANIAARDGGAEIVAATAGGHRARLADALYFWRTDQADLPDLPGSPIWPSASTSTSASRSISAWPGSTGWR